MAIRSVKVLVVGASKLVRKGYEIILRKHAVHSYQFVNAATGKEAPKALAEHPDCDLVILDSTTSEKSTGEFVKLCRQAPNSAEIPVIVVCTDRDREKMTVNGLEAGADAILTKPFAFCDLHSLVEEVLPAAAPIRANADRSG